MATVTLSINGATVTADVEPRLHLADFLRGDRHLTGTHLGCEQGVCGACTVLIDGKPQRSCLAFAVDCDGADVRSIEDFDDDPLMGELRDAFSASHALQCGFCTPGMLATARDIVSRLGEVSEHRIREELSGNICRCTGYVGIVEAIRTVSLGKQPVIVGAVAVQAPKITERGGPTEVPVVIPVARPAALALPTNVGAGTSIEERITIKAAPDKVWEALSDLRRVASCLPGAEITEIDGDTVKGRVRIALGPIKPAFSGEAHVTMDAARREGKMAGRGRDSGMGSSAEGEARWQVIEGATNGSVILVNLTWRLTGPLAQFNRSGLVQDIVRRLAATFATNLEASIDNRAAPLAASQAISAFGLFWSVIKARLFGR
ncbi:2Fe-2S iron-sulfur cluster binding domain-containing protein [Bradyrhizobium sp. KBS0727]|jgi:aerobic-type carbon monoxide dehydrogenase small subunit (CoxS/CutS family)/carbon monoxide dehydrogenase subunit G|uniref:xanthine dehydrogenase family Fe-S subunit n=1 Tax=unclassified Bradyrhizobium TaxID=2631580 RepID=UPI00110EBAE1|nr:MULTISPECIES: 2Fe-2S iron-sulfur cluster-binding protein [unclassified Bradyrhizobium]QDW38015.1 2Fe-2S iron-sulfur cluster binding domain-containing protein [Bradyrhizobium sp. KBS0725]QDW44619.1 2Fe-2S iron-sulfur cluster binding domain-containing protein [Bradyrhizobium sp. KBS0727]